MIKLPALCGARQSVELLFAGAPRETSLFISAKNVTSMAQGYADELCKQLIDQRIDSVTFIAPTERLLEFFMKAYRLRSGKFLVSWRG